MLLLLLLIGGGSYAWGEDFSATFLYGSLKDWTLTNYTDKEKFYLVPSGTEPSVATLSGIFKDKKVTSDVVVTINCATFGNGTNPNAQTFTFYTTSDCSSQISATQSGQLPNDGKKYKDVVYTIVKKNATSLSNDLAIEITKPGKQIRLKSIGVKFSYEAASAANLTSIVVSGTPTKTTYEEGEAFDPTGLVVTGTYDDGTKKEITEGIDWVKDPEILKLGTTSVDVMASVGNITSDIYTVEGITVKEKVTLIGIEANGTPAEFWKGDKFNHDGITVTAHWSDESESDVTEQCQFTEPDMTTAGKKTVTVTYENETCTYDIEVKTIENTKETAYTVSEAIKTIDAGKDLATQVYVKGVVSEIVTPYDPDFGNVSFNVSVDGSAEGEQFQFFRTQKDAKNKYTEDPNIEVGATVVGYGTLLLYKKTQEEIYEFAAGNYLVEYKAPVEKVLKSIAISGEATKTTYTEGETFDPTGLVVTATYDDESTRVVTNGVKWTCTPETLTLGATEVNVTATYGEKTASKTVAVTVTEAPKMVDIDLTKDQTTTATTDKLEWLGEFVTVTANKAKAETATNSFYPGKGKTSTRFYTGSTLTFTPAPFVVLGEITYEATTVGFAKVMAESQWKNATAEANGMSATITPIDGTKPVSATIGARTGGNSFSINYSLANEISLALVAKSNDTYYATFSSACACEFVGAEVFTVNVEGENIVLNEVASKQVPANTGVLVKSTANAVTVTRLESAPAIEGTNLLRPASEQMTEGFKYYKLAYDNYTEKTGLGFYWGAAEGGAFTVKPGLAYLAVPEAQAANVKGFSFDGTQTGINGVEATTAKGAIYNLNGQRVEKAQRGIYIQNGKKFIVK